MNGDDFQEYAALTAIYPQKEGTLYTILGLMGEVGEIAQKMKRRIRDGRAVSRDEMRDELGDVLWYVAMLAREFNISLDDVMQANILKLRDRRARGVIQGSGDNR